MIAVAFNMFRGKLIGCLGFSHRGEYIGGREASGGGPGGPTTWWRGQGLAHAIPWCGRPLVPLRLSFGLRHALGKIGTPAFVSSDFKKYFLCSFSETQNSRKQGAGTVASR
jgi:hypothetical protein